MVTDTSAAYQLLLNGSIFPAMHSYYTTVFNGWFWGLVTIVILILLLIKTKSATALFTASSIMSTILYLAGLLNRPTMGLLLIIIVLSGGSLLYTWLTK